MATFMVMTNEHSSPYHVIISFDEERLNDSLYLGMMTQQNELKKMQIYDSHKYNRRLFGTRSTEILINFWRDYQDVMNMQNLLLFCL